MKTIPFSIEYRSKIESGEYKVVTTLGQEVRIIDWDLKQGAARTIVGVVKSTSTGNENVRIYYADGTLKSSGHLDLMIQTDVSDLTDFQKAVKDLLKRFSVIVEDDEVIVKEAHKLENAKRCSVSKKECVNYEDDEIEEDSCDKQSIEQMLQPFDKILVRNAKSEHWKLAFFEDIVPTSGWCITINEPIPSVRAFIQYLPYNEETKALYGTKDEYNGKYKTWRD